MPLWTSPGRSRSPSPWTKPATQPWSKPSTSGPEMTSCTRCTRRLRPRLTWMRADRAVFTAIVYALTTGCAWRHLPAEFGVSKATAHRRFVAWTEAGLWRRLHRAVLDRLGERAAIDWSRAVVDAASVRAKKGAH